MQEDIFMRKAIYLTTILIALICITSCYYRRSYYYVDSIDMIISMDRIDYDKDIYRIYLSDRHNVNDSNYIEICKPPTEMPSVTFCFPIRKSGKMDTVYIKDRFSEISGYNSTDYTFIVSNLVETHNNSSGFNFGWSDSIMFKTPCIEVQVGPYFKSLTVFDEHGKPTQAQKL